MAQSEATKIVNRAAREHLRPLGLVQQGQSRYWTDDHGWWVIRVDFRSPAYAQGSRLTLYADFMWNGGLRDYSAASSAYVHMVREHGSVLDQRGPGIGGNYEDVGHEGFERLGQQLAERAAQEVLAWRATWPTLESWCDYLLDTSRGLFWPSYNAAFACAITGRAVEARACFIKMLESDDDRDWALAAKRDAEHLLDLLTDRPAFIAEAASRSERLRAKLRLTPTFQITTA
jgi:hypothetical protein